VRYADGRTQTAFMAWNAGASSVARAVTNSIFQSEPLIDRVLALVDRHADPV
jgi:hypothetical protein